MKKKILAVFLSLCMAMSLLPVTALAADAGDTDAKAASALPPADANGVIKLTSNVELDKPVDIDKTTTIDLNGYSITPESNWSRTEDGDYLISVKRGGNLTIEDSSTAKTGKIAGGKTDKVYAAVKVTITGEDNSDTQAILTVNGGELQGYYYAVAGNGTRHNTQITINGGKLTGTNGAGIYHPQDGTLTIAGGEITGEDTAVELRSGTLKISNGKLTATATQYSETQNNNGTTVSGAALAVSQHTTKKTISVTITGGEFNGAYALSETNVQNGEGTEDVEIVTISGGTFNGLVKSTDCTKFITGGTFSSDPSNTDGEATNYLATGYAATQQNGKYVVGPKDGGALEVTPSTDESGTTSATLEGIYAGENTPIEDASESGSETPDEAGTDVTVDLTTKDGETTETTGTVELTVNADTAKSLVSANANSLTVESDVGTVSLDKAALSKLENVESAVVISIEAKDAEEGAAPTWEVTVTSGSTEIFDEANNPAGTIEISVPAPTGASDNTKVYCIDNGMEDMRAVYNKDENTLEWTTEHLSTFAALDASQEASWTTANGTSGSGTLQAALEAVDEVGGTIVVNKNATLSNANFTIKKNVTIQGTGVITATVTNEKQHAFTVAPNSTLTLDGITLKIDGNTGYGFDVQYDATLTLNNRAIVDISNISNAIISSKPEDTTNPGKINVNNSVITANNIRGNFSNGGVWTIGTGSEVTIDTCQSHGFSASAIIVENGATVDIKNVAYRGISINDADGKLEIQDGGVVNVTNAGTADSDTYDAVYLHENASNGLIVQEGATLNVTAGKDGNDRIELSTAAASKSELDGTIIGTVDLPENASHWVVTYKDNGKNWKVELVDKNSATISLPTLSDQGYNHFQGWNDGTTTYAGGTEVTISKDTTFTAVWSYIPPANPNYRIDIPAAEGGPPPPTRAMPWAASPSPTASATP